MERKIPALTVRLITGLVSVAAVLTLSASAASAGVCGDRAGILSRFADAYREQPAIVGLTERGDVIEILRGPSGSWTLIATLPAGTTCIVMAGEALELLPASLPGRSS